jgi:asparagine synthase (glutamine-hydrolysing)
MCGIVGYLDPAVSRSEADALLDRMRSAIRHRGPDDDGQIAREGVGLGVQRLSILDLSTGHQPMTSADGCIWLVFNGEIYNHAELRKRHEGAGRSFKTRSDTEVVLAQYEKFGLDGIRDLNGMFGFAIWDNRAVELHLVRDRLGVKPLYYYADGRRVYFASEIKALIASGRFSVEPNEHAVWDYLTFRYVPAPHTIWSRIFKLPPAHTLTLRLDRLDAAPRRYWDMPYVEQAGSTGSGAREEFDALLGDAVRIRMLADVPVGVFLSGGLDSSAIAALVDRAKFPQLKTFSVTLEDSGEDDERAYARLVAKHLETDHREIVISDHQFIDMLPDVPHQTDEPMADPTCIPVFMLAKAAREQVKVVLSGEGADEILAGYSFDYIQKTWDEMAAAGNPAGSAQLQVPRAIHYPDTVDQRLVSVPLHITNYLTSEEKRAIFLEGRTYADSNDILRCDLARVRDNHPLHQSLYLYCQNWLVEDLLMKADKMTMAASIELRTPFLDYRLVEWAARAPASAKVQCSGDGQYVTKAVLRDCARQLLPAAIVERPKKGFPVPVYRWLSDRLRPLAFDLLTCSQPKSGCWLDPRALSKAVEIGTAPDAAVLDRHRLWNLIILELWARAWLP